jgi:tetratricopeptide (TPR) repeat protein
VPGRRRDRTRAVLAFLLASAALGRATEPPEEELDYRHLVLLYRSGGAEAAGELARAVDSGARWPRDWCRGREECEATAVLSLHAASILLVAAREENAERLVEATRPLVSRQNATFAFDWLLTAGALHQAHANHARAFRLYVEALRLRPADPSALLARATALEHSVIPDGFGAVVVADRDVWQILEPGGGEPPRELSYQLANPRTQAPWRQRLLELLTRQYRDVLELDSSRTEARLRLGRVLQARGREAEAEVELRTVASAAADPFSAAIARLCLARRETAPVRAAEAYRSALEVDAALSPAWLGLSQALHATGDREGAVAALERVLSLGGTRALTAWVDYHVGRGRAFPEALETLRSRLKLPS